MRFGGQGRSFTGSALFIGLSFIMDLEIRHRGDTAYDDHLGLVPDHSTTIIENATIRAMREATGNYRLTLLQFDGGPCSLAVWYFIPPSLTIPLGGDDRWSRAYKGGEYGPGLAVEFHTFPSNPFHFGCPAQPWSLIYAAASGNGHDNTTVARRIRVKEAERERLRREAALERQEVASYIARTRPRLSGALTPNTPYTPIAQMTDFEREQVKEITRSIKNTVSVRNPGTPYEQH
jgi:hypothetical protein